METSSTAEQNQTSPETTRSVLQAARVKQFMNILEQLPRLCSPTICGTLSQPTTRAERLSRGGDVFEWSLEQKAILSPANITTDTEGTDEWQQNMAELNQTWRQQESEQFFSQKTIAPSPLVTTPLTTTAKNGFKRPAPVRYEDLMYEEDEDEEEEEVEADVDDDDDESGDEGRGERGERSGRDTEALDMRRAVGNNDDDGGRDGEADEDVEMNYTGNKSSLRDSSMKNKSYKFLSYEFEDDCSPRGNMGANHDDSDTEFDYEDDEGDVDSDATDVDDDFDNHDSNRMQQSAGDDDGINNIEQQEDLDNLFFSPQPLRSSQTQQRVDIFSPESFGRVMEDTNTLQSTPKTTGSLASRTRTRTRQDMLD